MGGSTDCMWTGVFLGGVGAVSSDQWITIWAMMELNLMSFLPLIRKKWSIKKVSMTYFIVQRVGSLFVLRGIVTRWAAPGLVLKMSLAPLHFWGSMFVLYLGKIEILLFMTWQKMAPMILLVMSTAKTVLLAIVIINALISALCSIGGKHLYILLFFSGLLHVRWMVTTVFVWLYFVVYSVITVPALLRFNRLLMLNFAGMPPLTGFFLKLLLLQHIRSALAIVLVSSSLVFLYAYLRLFIREIPKIDWCLFVCFLGFLL